MLEIVATGSAQQAQITQTTRLRFIRRCAEMGAQSMRNFAIASVLFTTTAFAQEPKVSQWNGYEKIDYKFADHAALIVKPKTPAVGNPWIWRTEFFGHEPQGDIALLAAGWHVAYYQISDMYGSPASVGLMEKFHAHATAEHKLAKRVTLEGFSRGGLYAVNFAAANPDKTAALYLDAPVLDLRAWPGGKGKGKGAPREWKQALAVYGLTEETAATFTGNPIDKTAVLAKAKIPILSVCGTADQVVPFDENTKPFAEKIRSEGGVIEVIEKPGVDHHPHSLKDPKPIVDFLLKNALKD
jgi:pimeloyl-ACP methyl ester carboxylesterase